MYKKWWETLNLWRIQGQEKGKKERRPKQTQKIAHYQKASNGEGNNKWAGFLIIRIHWKEFKVAQSEEGGGSECSKKRP